MSKRKNNDPGRVRQLHPTRSFEQLVGEATQAKLSSYIDAEIQGLGQALLQRQQQGLAAMKQRIIAIEEILLETVPGLTKESLANRIADIQDRSEGFEPAEGGADAVVAEGDRVRLEIQTKTADQNEYQGTSRLQVDGAGSGNTLGKELETALLGMKAGEVKEVKFGKDESLNALMSVHKVSRKPAPKTETEAPEAATDTAKEETASASPDAG